MVNGTDRGQLGAEISTKDFKSMVSGVGSALGGDDGGPTPHEYLEAALAGCTIITVKMYAQRKQMKLVATHVSVDTISEGAVSKIARKIRFEGDLTPEERARLLEIANKCPIHKMLHGKIEVETLVEEV